MNRRSFFKRMFCGVAAVMGLPLADVPVKSEPNIKHRFDAREAFEQTTYKSSPTWISCSEDVYLKLEKLAKEKRTS